jgi:hypothetical protein
MDRMKEYRIPKKMRDQQKFQCGRNGSMDAFLEVLDDINRMEELVLQGHGR